MKTTLAATFLLMVLPLVDVRADDDFLDRVKAFEAATAKPAAKADPICDCSGVCAPNHCACKAKYECTVPERTSMEESDAVWEEADLQGYAYATCRGKRIGVYHATWPSPRKWSKQPPGWTKWNVLPPTRKQSSIPVMMQPMAFAGANCSASG